MKVKIFPRFITKLAKQSDFIALDKPVAAKKFVRDVFKEIRQLPKMPYSNRKSIFFEEDTFRDLTFKGYIIIYNINEAENQIEVFEFVKYVDKP